MMPRSLYARAALVFAAVLLALGALLSWAGYGAAKDHQHAILQRVNLGLAAHIAQQPALIADGRPDQARIDALFSHLMAVNPNIEVYLLDAEGRVLQASPEVGTPVRGRIDLAPVRALLAGGDLPLPGEDPLHAQGMEIFSAAPIRDARGDVRGYVYIVLLNDMYRGMVAEAWQGFVLRSAGWIAAFAVLAALAAGLVAFALITRRLRRLTHDVEGFADANGHGSELAPLATTGDEIDRLATSFGAMRARLQAQMQELQRQDELRRELVANVSHDLRTPLTSMQGYLETLVRMDPALSREEQREYLEIAVRQSHRVSRLAQQLFELARLECEETLPRPELFSIGELVQDIAQKYALTTQDKALQLRTEVEPGQLFVRADIGMIERVISNLMDNAIRHTPERGEILLQAGLRDRGVEVCVSDTGQGIAAEHLPGLLQRDSPLRQMATRRGGGLGLLIANRILDLHGSRMQAASRLGEGTRISFVLARPEIA